MYIFERERKNSCKMCGVYNKQVHFARHTCGMGTSKRNKCNKSSHLINNFFYSKFLEKSILYLKKKKKGKKLILMIFFADY